MLGNMDSERAFIEIYLFISQTSFRHCPLSFFWTIFIETAVLLNPITIQASRQVTYKEWDWWFHRLHIDFLFYLIFRYAFYCIKAVKQE